MRCLWLLVLVLAVTFASAQPETPLPAGVRAVWEAALAQREASATRERLCLNGLWRWQPAEPTATVVPDGNWGFFKVPGPWPGIQDWMQSDYQTLYAHPAWRGQPLDAVRAAWYQREIETPAGWAGRRLLLSVDWLNSLASVYLDGRAVGELRWPGGTLDLSTALQPGRRQRLSLLVVAAPLKAVRLSFADTNRAKEVPGRVARRGLCGNLWLVGEPAGARIGDVRLDPSVRTGQLRVSAALDGLADGARYTLRLRLHEPGQPVAELLSEPFDAGSLRDGRYSFAPAWQAAKTWDLDTPDNQVEADLALLADGKLADAALPRRFGWRELWIDGRDFYLNGTRLYLSAVPLDNAQVGAALSTYAAARESLLRLKRFGVNFVYTHNYGCEPGDHLALADILRAADDVGMLVALSQPHFGAYDWQAADADRANGYARDADWYVRQAANHPSVVCYATSHNATGYGEDMNPDKIDGLTDERDEWSKRNAAKALRAEGILHALDPARIVYHHSSGNLGSMHTVNFYPNFVPIAELDDWFGHWAEKGAKPCFLVEYGAPFGWDWTMYRGWYEGQREFGSAAVPWEFCLAEWNAQLLGDAAYRLTDREAANIRWEAQQFAQGRRWHRWDYPTAVGDSRLDALQPVQAAYTERNWRAFRTWGLSANSPWEFARFWTLRPGFQHRRQDLPVDWDHLQRPGYSPDYIDRTYERMDLAYDLSDWVETPTAKALLANNRPLLGYLAGSAERFASRDHIYRPGERIDKQLIVINSSRRTTTGAATASLPLDPRQEAEVRFNLGPGNQARQALNFTLPPTLKPGGYRLSATFSFAGGDTQIDALELQVISPPPVPTTARIALYDPPGHTSRLLASLGVRAQTIADAADLSGYDLLVIGQGALTVDGPAPDLKRVRDGLKVIVFEQTSAVLEQRLGLRCAEYGLRQVFCRVPDHPLLAGLNADLLRDWRGASTLLPPRLDYTLSARYNGVPTVRWCGLEVPRLWRCGNQGNVASVLIEKPARGDWLALVDGGFSLQYSPLLAWREGRGLVLFCQLDVSGRTAPEPAAELVAGNLLRYAQSWQPSPRRRARYVGDAAGQAWLAECGIGAATWRGEPLTADQALIVGPGGGAAAAQHKPELARWLAAGGRLLALGLDQDEANSFLPTPVTMRRAEHLATSFDPPAADSLLAGLGPADVHNRDPRVVPLVAGGLGDGVLAESGGVAFCQLTPWSFDASPARFNQRRTRRKLSATVSRMLGNLGVGGENPLLDRLSRPAQAGEQRWLTGLYLDQPTEWDDPYRFFRW